VTIVVAGNGRYGTTRKARRAKNACVQEGGMERTQNQEYYQEQVAMGSRIGRERRKRGKTKRERDRERATKKRVFGRERGLLFFLAERTQSNNNAESNAVHERETEREGERQGTAPRGTDEEENDLEG